MAHLNTHYMTICIEAYGAIERQLPKNYSVHSQANCSIGEVLEILIEHFPLTAPALERCACAIGDSIVSRDFVLQSDSTLVLLPPVAGG